jgi:hypothetical protein
VGHIAPPIYAGREFDAEDRRPEASGQEAPVEVMAALSIVDRARDQGTRAIAVAAGRLISGVAAAV